MNKIKLIKVYPGSYCNDCGETDGWVDDWSNWEEISNEDLQFLRKYVNEISQERYKVVILEEVNQNDTKKIITDVKEFVRKEKQKEEERIAALDRKKQDKLKKNEDKKIEKAKKLLQSKGMKVE